MRISERKKQRRKKMTYGLLSLLLFLALFTPLYHRLYDMFEGAFVSVYSNTEHIKHDTENIFSALFLREHILKENQQLKERVARLEAGILRTNQLEKLLKENENIKQKEIGNVFQTSVIRKNNKGVITILGGKDDALKEGAIVFSFDGTPIGIIAQVFDKSSFVDLFVKDGIETQGVLFPQDISVNFKGNGNALVAEVSRDIDVQEGNLVFSQNEPSLLLGIVSFVDFKPQDPSKKIFVAPLHSIEALQEVFVER